MIGSPLIRIGPLLHCSPDRIRYLFTYKLVTPNTFKMIVFNGDGVEVVTKCKRHEEAFVMDC